ncbi:hypothetical protein BGW80DRAFT_1377425, partial [Lactifluus volemus]
MLPPLLCRSIISVASFFSIASSDPRVTCPLLSVISVASLAPLLLPPWARPCHRSPCHGVAAEGTILSAATPWLDCAAIDSSLSPPPPMWSVFVA